MELFIKHKRPLQDFSSGKWLNREFPFMFYIILENKRVSVDPKGEKERQYILNLTIENVSSLGKYIEKEDCLLYKLNMEEHNFEVQEVKGFTNWFVISSKDSVS